MQVCEKEELEKLARELRSPQREGEKERARDHGEVERGEGREQEGKGELHVKERNVTFTWYH